MAKLKITYTVKVAEVGKKVLACVNRNWKHGDTSGSVVVAMETFTTIPEGSAWAQREALALQLKTN